MYVYIYIYICIHTYIHTYIYAYVNSTQALQARCEGELAKSGDVKTWLE